MKISVYSSAWNIKKYAFDYKDALDNWTSFADEIVISVGISEDNTYELLESYIKEKKYPVKLIRTNFDFKNDSFAYGKTENEALQNCTGDLMIQQNLDERLRVDKNKIQQLYELLKDSGSKAFFIPTIDLYGSSDKYISINRKWYWHLKNCYRGPVKFGLKQDGKPDYNKSSTDELIDENGNLVSTISLIDDLSLESISNYVNNGYPIVYHLGFLSLTDRLERSIWWKKYWEFATNGDKNQHASTIEELANRETKKHNLPLWKNYTI